MTGPFIGQTRYSLFVPDSGAWRASNGTAIRDEATYKSYLYDPDRLAFRDRIFTELAVPSLAHAAEGFDVTHIVSYSESLPERYKDSLRATEEKYPVISLRELKDGTHDWSEAVSFARDEKGPGVFGRYRIDDDDILATNYFKLMSKYLKAEFVGMVASLPLGVEAIYDDGHFFNFRQAHVPMNSVGLLYVSKLHDDGVISASPGAAHDKSDRVAPVILDSSHVAYLRINHEGQDNLLRHGSGNVLNQVTENMAEFPALGKPNLLRDNFPVIAEQVLGPGVVRTLNTTLRDGITLTIDGASAGVNVVINGTAPLGLAPDSVALAVDLGASGGRDVWLADVPGLALSSRPGIGRFAYADVGKGEFETMGSFYIPGGFWVRRVRIVPLTPEAQEIAVNSIAVSHSGSAWTSEESAPVWPTRQVRVARAKSSTVRFGRKVWRRIRGPIAQILGEERTKSMAKFINAKLS